MHQMKGHILLNQDLHQNMDSSLDKIVFGAKFTSLV